jgi:hypothetical protein
MLGGLDEWEPLDSRAETLPVLLTRMPCRGWPELSGLQCQERFAGIARIRAMIRAVTDSGRTSDKSNAPLSVTIVSVFLDESTIT